jgi:hypothetical protein
LHSGQSGQESGSERQGQKLPGPGDKELMHTVLPHPTLSEMMNEAVLDAYGRVLNM